VATAGSVTPEARTPEEAAAGFVSDLLAGDSDSAALRFSRRGCFVTADGTAIHGREQIGSVLAQLVAICQSVEVELRSLLVAGDVALCSEHWTMRFAGNGGPAVTRTSRSASVIGRVEGTWKLMVVAPWWS
jgi:ketosteroid isomerase-like protein